MKGWIIYAQVSTAIVTGFVSEGMSDFACQCTMCSAFIGETTICSYLWQKAITLARDQVEQKPTWSIDLVRMSTETIYRLAHLHLAPSRETFVK
jgi:hypothetical protein